MYVFDILFHHFPDEPWTEQLLVLRPQIKDTLLPLLEDNNNRHEIHLFSQEWMHLMFTKELCVVRLHHCCTPIMDADGALFLANHGLAFMMMKSHRDCSNPFGSVKRWPIGCCEPPKLNFVLTCVLKWKPDPGTDVDKWKDRSFSMRWTLRMKTICATHAKIPCVLPFTKTKIERLVALRWRLPKGTVWRNRRYYKHDCMTCMDSETM